jgi:acetyltransferase-like isoleucine patch superfamily enzyme
MISRDEFERKNFTCIIYPSAIIPVLSKVQIGEQSQIDDFTFLYAGNGIKIGKHVHIAAHCSVIGAGYFEIGDYGAMATGSRVLTSTNDHRGGYHMSAAAPREEQNIVSGKVIIGKDGFLGANVVVHPNVELAEGVVIGSNSLVLKSIKEPWTIWGGNPLRFIKKREVVKR